MTFLTEKKRNFLIEKVFKFLEKKFERLKLRQEQEQQEQV